MNLSSVIKRPVVTEKAMKAMEKNRFTLEVDRRATKGQIKRAIEEQFKVNVIKVNKVTTGEQKKAVVQLKAGQTIGILAGGKEK
ncbi:MAG: 50S ribosomal protein L23 [Candidatus Chisholmbacteria bacterium RIFCSPHIGHO2_01_FULL_48_12]|uniref:Large ribosomal subunit protein uL23 n=1 Tax=Candidatus Chisholmbacteria bacterium RIFCSPHIGHO2_01_FULL_48_12 TaxID=1797589 RepID=A0A1G1VKC0_9BACT|nr:MAG: 50S ribosomal protein L23 [Candidatus Chisholmbacteria bacterium RIFCSPHIGHO2_01_FULL_48_12]